MATSSQALSGAEMIIPDAPHQPLNFAFPKRSFGLKKVVKRSFQPDWFSKWPFIHYDEARDVAYCHTCLMGIKSKRVKTNNADPAFVSITIT